jgi:hypothetical protein
MLINDGKRRKHKVKLTGVPTHSQNTTTVAKKKASKNKEISLL